MERAVANGVKNLVGQPTHLMHGAEYDETMEMVDSYRDKFESVAIAEPLLGEVGSEATVINADKEAVAKAVTAAAVKDAGFDSLEAAAEEKVAFVFMGHGTSHTAKVSYSQMQTAMQTLGYSNVFIGTVEGEPEETACENVIEAVKAVFRSWDNPRANVYRKMNEIPYEWGTAVNVQQMAFGNSGDRSGTGVAFTRDPATGAKKLMGEYLINAQGEDVVAGVRTPSPISHLKDQMPEVYDQFVEIATRLENYFRDMQDMEFTIEDGHLYMLQTRNGKRTAQAALQIACDLVDEGMITEQEAVLRVEPKQLDTLLHPQFDAAALKAAEVVGKGLAASPGSACGQIVFTAEEAEEMVKSGKMKKVVLVRLETSPEDIVGMQVSQGILTVRGGMTSHAAVVARGMGTCCVSGCGNDYEVKSDEEAKTFEINGHKFVEGDWISIDGSTGNIYGEQVATVAATGNKNFNRFMGWADAARQLLVMTNADNPRDAQQAVDLGAEGIGLCRTEHMFFAEDRIKAVSEMI